MSKIRLYGSTSGYVDLAAPAVADDATLTLPTAAAGFGKMLQVVSTTKTDTFSTTSETFTTVTGLTANITPSSATSKVLIIASVATTYSDSSNARSAQLQLRRGATDLGVAASPGDRQSSMGGLNVYPFERIATTTTLTFLDSPATTSATTYGVAVRRGAITGTVYVNRANDDTDSSGHNRYVSTITLMEVAA